MKFEPVFSHEEVVFYDTDSGGVVSNIAYLRFVEKARCLLFNSVGMGLKDMSETQIYATVVRTEIDYRRPARLGDKVVVEASIESVEKVRIQCRFEVHEETNSDGENKPIVFATALQTIALVKMPEGKPVRSPQEWR